MFQVPFHEPDREVAGKAEVPMEAPPPDNQNIGGHSTGWQSDVVLTLFHVHDSHMYYIKILHGKNVMAYTLVYHEYYTRIQSWLY